MINSKYISKILSSYDIVTEMNHLYLASEITNAFFDVMLTDGRVNVHYLPNESYDENLVIGLVKYRESIVIVPWNAKDIYIYNIEDNEIRKLDGVLQKAEREIKGKFICAVLYEQKIILLGENIHSIIVLEGRVESNEFEVKRIECDSNYLYSVNYSIYNKILYVPIRNTFKIMAISLEDYTKKIISLDNHAKTINNGVINLLDDSAECLVEYNRHVSIGLESNKIKEEILVNSDAVSYDKIFHIDSNWIYISLQEGKIGIRRDGDKEIQGVPFNIDSSALKYRRRSENILIFAKEKNGRVYFQERMSGKYYYVDLASRTIREVMFRVKDELYADIVEKVRDSFMKSRVLHPVQESYLLDIKELIRSI